MIDLLVFGGDASRCQNWPDASDNITLVDQFTGSSFASMATARFSAEVRLDDLRDPSARHIIERDFGKRFLRTVQHSTFDFMLLDFLEERFDLCLAEDGSICTISDQILDSDILKGVEKYSVVKNSSRQYFSFWSKGWQRFLRYAELAGVTSKIRVGLCLWGVTPEACGGHEAKILQKDVKLRNELLARMYSRVEQDLGSNALIKLPAKSSTVFVGEGVTSDISDQIARIRQGMTKQIFPYGDQSNAPELSTAPPFERRKPELTSAKQADLGRSFLEHGEFAVEGFQKHRFGKNIDWTSDPFKNRTWQWSLFQHSFIPSLIAFDLVEGNNVGLFKAVELLKDWADRFLYADLAEPAWHDHGSALRARNILLCYCRFKDLALQECSSEELLRNISIIERLSEYLAVHCANLAQESFYSVGTNHGLDQSLVLYEIASYLPASARVSAWKSIARRRISYEIGMAFASDGGHVENSPGYLNFGLKQAVNAMTLRSAYDDESDDLEGSDNVGLLDRGCRALTHMMRPDGRLPIIGDTAEFTVKDFFTAIRPSLPIYEEFRYVVTKGQSGSKPDKNCLVLPDSGYAIFRSGWSEMKAFEDSIHAVFKCGFLSTYHRHDDDLHLVLAGFGEDWLIDGGLYKHEPKDPLRIYCRSSAAHNLTVPVGAKASRDLASARSKITSYVDDGEILSVTGETNMFRGYLSSRTVSFDTSNFEFMLLDRIFPVLEDGSKLTEPEVKDYVSRFLVPHNKAVSVVGDQVIVKGMFATMVISSKLKPKLIQIRSGSKQQPMVGWTSRVQHKIEPAIAIDFNFASKDLENEISIKFQR